MNLELYIKLLSSSEYLFNYSFCKKLIELKTIKSFIRDKDWKSLLKRKFFLDSFLINDLKFNEHLMLIDHEPKLSERIKRRRNVYGLA